MKHIKYIFLSVVALTMASCGKEMTTDELIQKLPAPEVKLSISYGYGSELRVGRTKNINISWNFDGNNVIWATSNNNVELLSNSSLNTRNSVYVKGIAQGKTIVRAHIGGYQGYEGSIELEVLPLADFNVRQTSGTKKMIYTYVAEDNEYYRAEWYFGDGDSYTTYSDPRYDGVNHYYSYSGTYNVTLSLYTSSGKLIDTFTKSVTVN